VIARTDSIAAADDAFERSLEAIRGVSADPLEGLFGPRSMLWRIDREAALFLGAGRALLLQLAHPWVAAAVAEHSRAIADPIGRFHRTFGIVFAMVFGTRAQALAAARRLRRRHASVRGVMPEAAGPFAAGSLYLANDADALLWVHATLIETAIIVHDLMHPPLSIGERERYYAETKILAALFGIPQSCLPSSWARFAAYCEAMHASDTLTVSPSAREIATAILAGSGSWLPVPGWYRSLTAGLLPRRLRADFGLAYDSGEKRAAERALGVLRRLYPMLPSRCRHVGPYHEAMGRLAGRPAPDLPTRLLNRFWIGKSEIE